MTDPLNPEAASPGADSDPEIVGKPALTEPTTITVAELDANGVYWGVQTIAHTDLTPEHVPVPADCDLTPGRYRWSAADQRFEPLLEHQVPSQPDRVSLELAVYELILLAQKQGELPPRLAQFAAHFKTTIDAIGSEK